jgi:hypothetical protein
MNTRQISYLVSLLLLLIPINIYIIGDWIGIGIQSSFLNYKVTYLGTSLTHEFTEMNYVISGILEGKSALSVTAWFAGFILLIMAMIAMLLYDLGKEKGSHHYPEHLFVIAGLSFLLSCIIQYGIVLHGPAGWSFPIGVPLFLYFGWWYHRNIGRGSENLSQDTDRATIDDDGSTADTES